MKIHKIIKSSIYQYLKEYNEEDSFLFNYNTAIKYAYNNIDDIGEVFDEYEENPDNIYTSHKRDNYIELIELYVDKYNELKDKNSVTIYRLIKLDSMEDLDINNVGMHWSFDKDGVGAYGERHPNRGMMRTGEPFILVGNVNPNDIDWIYGFNSFIWYGEDQWECALNKGTRVEIISINDKELEEPIIAVVGDF